MMVSIGRALSMAVVGMLVLACGDDDKPKAGNGVNDVRKACEIRTQWNRVNNQCDVCEAAVISPRCECSELAAFSAACIEQADARKPVCNETIQACVDKCFRDCACLEACYANDAACRTASAARDGCVAEACASYCK